ncbi:hypothetical protein LSH36_59g07038 [Paralvinella palmiformis]|uniref:SH2 domain-containing protein n=1 Tax=Paralvinella palmiformis TaxID=53620 RepID=A0AAD9K576_9ANNE|nr:hypothetical protein LSH36_59g07038 [Paralvinella palmiformis]
MKIDKILTPHLTKEGSFILRPSQTNPGQNTISVIEDGKILHYRILKYGNKYSIYPRGPYFSSEYVLLNHYSSHSLSIPGALLKHPINYVPQFDDHH